MNDKDKDIATFGRLRIKQGFLKHSDDRKLSRPKHCIVTLLNVNPNNIEEIVEFCENYKLIFYPSNSIKNSFAKLQNKFRFIIEEYKANSRLKTGHLNEINSKLGTIKKQLKVISLDKANRTNNCISLLTNEEYDNEIYSKYESYEYVYCYPDSETIFWEDLTNLIKSNNKILNCNNCGKYYSPTNKSRNQLFCSSICQERHKKKRKYKLKSPRHSP